MNYKKPLKRLGQEQFADDIKKFIKSTHKFYSSKIPEMKVMAKKLHDEHNLREFYRVFNRLWKSGYHNERVLAIHALELYKKDFNLDTWKFIRPRLREIRDWEELDFIAQKIIGELLKFSSVRADVLNLSKKRDAYLRRMALMSCLNLVKEKDFKFALKVLGFYVQDRQEKIQWAVGLLVREIGKVDKEVARKFILKNSKMGDVAFETATKDMKELRRVRELKKLGSDEKFDKKGLWGWLR